MTRVEKNELISYLEEEFKQAGGIVVCDYKGMSVENIESLRNKAREISAKVKVVKNSLAMIALDKIGAENFELKDTNIVIWSEDQVSLCKLVIDFAKDEEKLIVKNGYVDGSIVTEEQIKAISKLPSKEELIGMLLSVWTAPLRNMASLLSAPQRELATVLNNIKIKKEEEA